MSTATESLVRSPGQHMRDDLHLAWRLCGNMGRRREIARDEFLAKGLNTIRDIVHDAWITLSHEENDRKTAHEAAGRARRAKADRIL